IFAFLHLYFFMTATATSEIYTLSLHDALPISLRLYVNRHLFLGLYEYECMFAHYPAGAFYKKHLDAFKSGINRRLSTVLYLNPRSEEHTSELQSRENLVCRLLLEKKNKNVKYK